MPPVSETHPSNPLAWRWIFTFLGFTAMVSLFALWLLNRHYINDASLWTFSTVISSLDGEQGGFNRFVLLYPQVQYYVLTVLLAIPGLKTMMLPYLISALYAAGLLTHFTYRLASYETPPWLILMTLLLIIFNPVFLWAATNGGGEILGILLYYVLGLAIIGLRYSHSLHSHILLGLVLVLFFISDARSVYLSLALIFMLPFVIQKHIMKINPVIPIVVLYTPLVFMIFTWLALNWVYTRDALKFLEDPASPFLGARLSTEHLPWRAGFGSQFLPATGVAALLMVLSYPVLLIMLFRDFRKSRLFGGVLALTVTPVIATGLATAAEFTQSPADLLIFVLGGVMVLLTAGPMLRRRPFLVLLALFVGNFASVSLFQYYPATGMRNWVSALNGQIAEPPLQGDIALGIWSRNLDGLMVDENSGYGVIAARGNAKGMYLTFSDRFKNSIGRGRLQADWVAVPEVSQSQRDKDQIIAAFPRLYEEGHRGYVLAYDHLGWRVYVKDALWPPTKARVDLGVRSGPGGR